MQKVSTEALLSLIFIFPEDWIKATNMWEIN